MTKQGRGTPGNPKEKQRKAGVDAVRSAAARNWRARQKEEEEERQRIAREKGRQKLQAQLLGTAAIAATAGKQAVARERKAASPATKEGFPLLLGRIRLCRRLPRS